MNPTPGEWYIDPFLIVKTENKIVALCGLAITAEEYEESYANALYVSKSKNMAILLRKSLVHLLQYRDATQTSREIQDLLNSLETKEKGLPKEP